MLAIIIKNLKLHLNNKNLPIRKIKIRFEPLAQKSKTDKYSYLFYSFFGIATI